MSAPTVDVAARLVLDPEPEVPLDPTSWFITHGIGGPAAGTFTEVAIAEDVLELLLELHDRDVVVELLERAVRHVAGQLYGTAYAFTYRPGQYADAIARHGMRRREVVVVSALEVYP